MLDARLTKLTSDKDRSIKKYDNDAILLSSYPSIDHRTGLISSTHLSFPLRGILMLTKNRTIVAEKTSARSIASAHPPLLPISFRRCTNPKRISEVLSEQYRDRFHLCYTRRTASMNLLPADVSKISAYANFFAWTITG